MEKKQIGQVEIYNSIDLATKTLVSDIGHVLKVLSAYRKPFVLGFSEGKNVEKLYNALQEANIDLSYTPILILEKQLGKGNITNPSSLKKKNVSPIGDFSESELEEILDKNIGNLIVKGNQIFRNSRKFSNVDPLSQTIDLFEDNLRKYGGIDVGVFELGQDGRILHNYDVPFAKTHIVKEPDGKYHLTLGMENLLRGTTGDDKIPLIRQVVIFGFGNENAYAVKEMVEGEKDGKNPSSIIRHSRDNLRIVVDQAAAKYLPESRKVPAKYRIGDREIEHGVAKSPLYR